MNDISVQLEDLLGAARRLAVDAGDQIMEIYNNHDLDVTAKDDKSPLTAADLAAHQIIKNGLEALAPKFPVLSEESNQLPFNTRASRTTYWLIDPLDGTREFIKRNGEFTVNIALIHGHDAVLGVVAAPAKHLSYFACRGQGAHKTVNGGEPTRIETRKLTPKQPVVAGSRSHAGDSLAAFLDKLSEHEMISMGSALKFCLVAEGTVDIYPRFGPTSEWDTAAAQCVVEEAGGQVTSLELNRLRYNTKDSLLNPHFVVIGNPAYDWAKYF
jgi:3'(2'), 5'-bisphosphate nucleotidase